MTQPQVKLGALLRELRQRAGATQKEVADALRVGETSISQYETGKPVPEARLRDFATFVVLRNAGKNDAPVTDSGFTEVQRAERSAILTQLRAARRPGADEHAVVVRPALAPAPAAPMDLWTFEAGEPIMIVVGRLEDMTHPYANPRDPNYSELLTFADLDALIELHGHLARRNPDSEVRFVRSDRFLEADQLSSHIVVIGGPGLNQTLEQLFEGTDLPISQEEHPEVENGEVFYVAGKDPELPLFTGRGTLRLSGDIGLFARLTNPFNSARTLTWCSGVYSRGVLGSVRLLTDAALRDQNGTYLAQRFADAKQFAIMARVPVVSGRALTPDLHNEDARLYEWSDDAEQLGEARPDGDTPEAAR
jgi:transcriptional regulator with XRE-family HTH domain